MLRGRIICRRGVTLEKESRGKKYGQEEEAEAKYV